MAEKMGRTEPFQSGQKTNDRDKGEKVPIKNNMSKVRNAGQPDPLKDALKGRQSYIPSDLHRFSHSGTAKAAGAHYTPAGEFGVLKKKKGA